MSDRSSDIAIGADLALAALVVDTMGDAVITIDADGLIHSVNRAAERVFGYSQAETVGRNINILMPEPDHSLHDSYLDRYQKTGEKRLIGIGRDVTALRKDGSTFLAHLSVSEVWIDGVQWFAGIVRQLTDDEKQERSELLDLAPAAVTVRDANGTIQFWNARAEQLFGWSASEVIGQSSYKVLKTRFPTSLDAVSAQLESADSWEGELIHIARDGREVPVQSMWARRRDGAVIEINTDISQAKAAEAVLRHRASEIETSARIDRIGARIMSAFSAITDPTTLSQEVLKILADELGYRPLAFYAYDDWRGTLTIAAKLGLPPDFTEHEFQIGEGLVGESAHNRTPTFVNAPTNSSFSIDTGVGTLPAATMFVLPLIHQELLLGSIVGGSSEQLTERERSWLPQIAAQVAVGMYAAGQFSQLKELSAQLSERSRRVESQNLELARASQMKSEFLASMSHELRTPLNAIIGFSEVLRDGMLGELPPDQLDYVGEIYDAGRHLLSLINDILDLSKIEVGKMTLDVEDVDINDIVLNSLKIVEEMATNNGVTLSQSVEPVARHVTADGRKIRQIVYNLLSNAVKFTPSGGSVAVDVTNDDQSIRITVSDTGIGISPADQTRLFKSFEQLDSGMDRKYAGTGLGLSMVKRLAELHGGAVGVDSKVGRGSSFWVSLPRGPVRGPATPVAVDSPGSVPIQAHAAAHHVADVLVVEADPDAMNLIQGWLLEAGFASHAATEPAEASAQLAATAIDVILVDVDSSPDDPAFEWLTLVRADHKFGQIPVVMITATAQDERTVPFPATVVVQKPVSEAQILAAIESLLITPRPGGETPRILVVDDDPRAVELIAIRLESEGMQVARSYGGKDALEQVAAGGISAIVLDLMMPEVTGFDVIAKLRSTPETAGIPVVVISAKALTPTEQDMLNASASLVLAKSEWDSSLVATAVRQAVQAGAKARRRTDDQTAMVSANAHDGNHILVLAEEAGSRELFRLYLEAEGFSVTVADSANDALLKLDGARPDLITLDLNLGDIAGLEFLQRVSQTDLRAIPVLAVSSTDNPEQALAYGATMVLPKPFKRDELLTHIDLLLGGRGGGRPSVMIVDDDPKVVKILSAYFKDEQIDVFYEYSGRAAIESIAQRRPNLLVLDIMMPDMNGFEVLAILREDPQTADLPVVILTAKTLNAADREALSSAQAIFRKAATSRSDLLGTVRALLGSSKSSSAGNIR